MADEKTFNFKKWFFSLIPANGEAWGKWLDFGWKLLVVVLVWFWVIAPIKERLMPKKQASVESISGGENDLSNNKKVKSGVNILNFG